MGLLSGGQILAKKRQLFGADSENSPGTAVTTFEGMYVLTFYANIDRYIVIIQANSIQFQDKHLVQSKRNFELLPMPLERNLTKTHKKE